MAKYASMVKETTTTTGTGTLTLDGAVTGYRAFLDPSHISTNQYVMYYLFDANGTAWEQGFGIITSGASDTLSRARILESTNSNAAITLTTGTHTVQMAPHPHLTHYELGCYTVNASSFSVTSGNTDYIAWYDTLPLSTLYESESGMVSGDNITLPSWASRIRCHLDVEFDSFTDTDGVNVIMNAGSDQAWNMGIETMTKYNPYSTTQRCRMEGEFVLKPDAVSTDALVVNVLITNSSGSTCSVAADSAYIAVEILE